MLWLIILVVCGTALFLYERNHSDLGEGFFDFLLVVLSVAWCIWCPVSTVVHYNHVLSLQQNMQQGLIAHDQYTAQDLLITRIVETYPLEFGTLMDRSSELLKTQMSLACSYLDKEYCYKYERTCILKRIRWYENRWLLPSLYYGGPDG